MVSFRATVRNAMTDGRVTTQEAEQIIAHAKQNGIVSRGERATIAALHNLPAGRIDDAAKIMLAQMLGLEQPPPVVGGGALALSPGSARPVFLTSSGNFSADAGVDRPRNNTELGEGLFRAAMLAADGPSNPFARTDLQLSTREKVFANLVNALRSVPPGGALPAGLNADQALQLRSSAATVLLALAESTPATGPSGDVKVKMVKAYESLVRAETDPRLRESMIFSMHATKASLGVEGKAVAEALMREVAPLSLPYEKWFKDGNNTVNISWHAGGEFVSGWKDWLKKEGWKEAGASSGWGPSKWEKEVDKNGVKTKFVIELDSNRDNMFTKTGDPNTQIVGYDGHSDWGRAINRSLKGGPKDVTGKDQLLFYGLCVGKGTLDKVRNQYPDAQVVTTYNSSSFYQSNPFDENKNALMMILDGIANRQPWAPIRKNMERADFINPQPLESNYITPVDTMVRRRVLDRDHDGRADMMDRLYNVSTFRPQADRARDFSPLDAGQPASSINGQAMFMGVMMLNTISEFNETLHDVNIDGHVHPGGFFEGKDTDPVVKFEPVTDEDGKKGLRLMVNSRYAHMSEESMRVMLLVEFNRSMDSQPGFPLKGVDNKLQSLILAAHSLSVDDTYSDGEVWTAFLKKYNFPADISLSTVMGVKERGHWYAGGREAAKALKDALTPQQLQALSNANVGTPVLGNV